MLGWAMAIDASGWPHLDLLAAATSLYLTQFSQHNLDGSIQRDQHKLNQMK